MGKIISVNIRPPTQKPPQQILKNSHLISHYFNSNESDIILGQHHDTKIKVDQCCAYEATTLKKKTDIKENPCYDIVN